MFFEKQNGISWIVVCLGNPGPQYEQTRHNVGFMLADELGERLRTPIARLKFRALTASVTLGGEKVLLMKPITYMNLSGEAAREAAQFYHVPPEQVLVVSDEVALPVGKIRVRGSGSAGGHNGLKSMIAQLGSDAFPRIRIGVGAKPHPDYDMADWVLGKFPTPDQPALREALSRAADAAECVIEKGFAEAMNRFN